MHKGIGNDAAGICFRAILTGESEYFSGSHGLDPATLHSSLRPIKWTVVYWTTVLLTGDRESGFDSGEAA